MSDLTLDDFTNPKIDIHEIEFMGKRGYIRALSFDSQMEIARRFGGKEDEEANADDMKAILAYTLSDKDGNLLFDDVDYAVKILGNMSGAVLLDLFNQVQAHNGLDIEEESKNLKAVP